MAGHLSRAEPRDIIMYWVYILRCGDESLYTGIARDLKRRMAEHRSGKGARYTRGRGPVTLVYKEKHPDRSSATKRENQIHRWGREKKLALIHAGG